MKKIFFISFFLISVITISAQNKFEYFPSKLNVQPFGANTLEPKMGFLFQTGKNDLRLDIGNSMDILWYDFNTNMRFSFGADFFTYTLLRGESNFHFPVDAVDYLFGFNFGITIDEGNRSYGARLRISHISAHFVDGHYDGIKQQWRDGLNPRVYSREFVEFMPFYKIDNIRFYLGFTYLINVDPPKLGKDSYQVGFDYFAQDLVGSVLTPFVAFDLKLINIDTYTANNTIKAGIKFGKPFSKGFSLYYEYYSGKNMHGEYFWQNENYSAIGINLDL